MVGVMLSLIWIKPAKALTPGQAISFHENRIETQKKVINHANHWRPIGNGWFVKLFLNQAKVIVAKKKILQSTHILRRLYPLLGSKRSWLCIHHYEGSWRDSGGPYYGGLQMDYQFMRTYGSDYLRRFGPAYNWNPYDQMIVAQRAYNSGRGYYPWPNTARACGLL